MWKSSLFGLLTATAIAGNPPQPQTKFFTQQLDHFNPQDERTFQEKYLIYDGYYKGGDSPWFVYAGNEGAIEGFYNASGFVIEYAQKAGALILFPEHRYYGSSQPFGPYSHERQNMQYLTVELAVADYAYFVETLKTQYGGKAVDAPVVVFGGSYGGILAAACRIHYPATFMSALAASAPVPQTLNTVNPYVFFKLVTNDYEEVDPICPTLVRQGYAQLLGLASTGANGYAQLTKQFSLCSPLESEYDVTYLQLWARNAFLTMAMADYPYATDFLGSLPAWPVNATCDVLKSHQSDPLEALAAAAGFYYNASMDYSLTCFNITQEFVLCADQTGCGTGPDAISWDYQMCTEIVYGQDTNNETDMFPPRIWELNNLTEYCHENYQVTPEPTWMQEWYPLNVGAATTKVIWSNGLLDPWHGGGYLTSPGPDQPALIIAQGAHHLDLRGSNPQDPQSVITVRQQEQAQINQWLQDYYNDMNANGKRGQQRFKPVHLK